MKDCIIKWDCNNWYKDENDMIHILNQRGNRIILNKNQRAVWDAINYQTTYESLIKNTKLKDVLRETEIAEILSLFKANKVISIRNMDELFDSIFG